MTATATSAAAVIILILSATLGLASAQAPSPAPSMMSLTPSYSPGPMASSGPSAPGPAGPDCATQLLTMVDCLSYVQENSTVAKPDKACCPELAALVASSPICLCELLGNPNASPVKIDVSRAMKLPSVCSVSTPPPSTCAALGYQVPGPTSSPMAAPPGGEAGGPAGLAASPSTGNNGTGGVSSRKIALAEEAFFAASAILVFTFFFF